MYFRYFPKEKKPQRLLYGGKGFYAYLGHKPQLLKRNVNPVIVIEFQWIPDTRVKLKRFGVELWLIDGDAANPAVRLIDIAAKAARDG